ncbi:hypothetical protein [Pedobacter paludis]|uniref:Uncharacterized protein n=1 Tax=Pedobacter paludis TaxID=2203212 RepID=A0A317F472_9SPHI|nr:hypothetical protein [Pedobacter paludis]PWS32288.1 hypothetical protein DF947_11010 [Pedobacter paludis]
MKNVIVILLVFCFGCTNKAPEKKENVNEEVQVILNTFANGIYWVSENDFKDMQAEVHHLPLKITKRLRKYTVTDSLLSMGEFRFAHSDTAGKLIKKTVPFQFETFKNFKDIVGFEIIKASKNVAELDSNYNGNLTFSRVIFNYQRNRAQYYFEQSKTVGVGRGWGMGTYIYAKKIKGIWTFDKKEELWIT